MIPAEQALIDQWKWQHGIAGQANIVRFDGDDIVGVAEARSVESAACIIAAHNFALDKLAAALLASPSLHREEDK